MLNFEPTIYHHLDYSDIPNSVSVPHPLLALAMIHKGKRVACSVDADYLELLKENQKTNCEMVDIDLIVEKLRSLLKDVVNPSIILPKDMYLEKAFPNSQFAPSLSYNELLQVGFQLYKNGIFIGLQSISACVMAKQENKKFLSIDSCWLYSSTLLNKSHLTEHGVIRNEVEYMGATVEDLQLPHAVLAKKDMLVKDALDCMMDFDFTFMPVTKEKKLIGWVNRDILIRMDDNKTVGECMTKRPRQKFIKITPSTPLQELKEFLDLYPVAFITDGNGKFVLGVATKTDLAKFAESTPFMQ
eukprot:NODE_364_length_10092_cov_0.435905.p4 type:complete len:300 gc:universal NODE_364_length_10092_cov_0.435905:4251-5150(+)